MPWIGRCSGTVISAEKKQNCTAQSVQSTRLRRASAKLAPSAGAVACPESPVRTGGLFMINAANNSNATAPPPITITAGRHPIPEIISAATGGTVTWPTAVPTLTTAVMMPRRPSNQRATVDSVTTSWVLSPSPMKLPQMAKSCQGWLTCDNSAKPSP